MSCGKAIVSAHLNSAVPQCYLRSDGLIWAGDDTTNGEYEIYGQRVEAATGIEIGGDVRLSATGPDGDTAYDAYQPAVVYNSTDNEYLVVWRGDDDSGALVDEEFEIYGERVDAASGAELTADLRLSDMGPDGNANYDAWEPAVAYNSTSNQYLAVWRGDDDTAPLVDEEFEVFAQRLNAASGVPLGANDFRLSDMGPNGDANYDASVDGADYTIWADHYQQAGAGWGGGDFNGDGTVDGADYTIWADFYGTGGAGTPVPEPLTASLVLAGAVLVIRRRA